MTTTTTAIAKTQAQTPATTGTATIGQLVANMAPDLSKTLRIANGMLTLATTMTITNSDDLAYAQQELLNVTGAAKALETRRKTYSVPLNDALKEVNAAFKPVSEVLGQASEKLRNLTGAYVLAQERARAEEAATQARLARIEAERRAADQLEAEHAAEAQRAAVAQIEAERLAQAGDAQRRAADLVETASQRAEDLLKAGDSVGAAEAAQVAADAMRTETDAKAAADVARSQAAQEIERINETAALAVVTSAQPAAPSAPERVSGVSWKKAHKFEVTNIVELCAFIAQNPSMAHLVLPNEAEIKKLVKLHGMTTALPGVTVTDAIDMKVRA